MLATAITLLGELATITTSAVAVAMVAVDVVLLPGAETVTLKWRTSAGFPAVLSVKLAVAVVAPLWMIDAADVAGSIAKKVKA